jgi:cell division protein FtsW (lipid II flippase)
VNVRSLRGALHWPVIVPGVLLLLIGMYVLSGIDIRVGYRWLSDWHVRQLSGVLLGLAASVLVILVPYKEIVRRAYLFYAVNIVLLVLVILVGATRNESRRWLSLMGFDFQPSELMKLTLVITLARFIRFRSSYKTFRGLTAPFLLTLLPMALILKQPDLGTALLCIPLLFTMLFVAGARARHLLLILVLGASAIFPVYKWGLKDYQRRRVDGFIAQLPFVGKTKEELKDLAKGQNFQVHQSKIAIGSGGVIGASGHERAVHWVPERHNDFIFAVVGHQLGLFGGMFVFLLYACLLLAILFVAMHHRDPAGRLICVGVFALFGFQAFINISMTVGLMPITGLTLPLLSYGRSSVVVSIIGLALVCNVAARPSYEFGRGDFD